jgi:hypothetical protein
LWPKFEPRLAARTGPFWIAIEEDARFGMPAFGRLSAVISAHGLVAPVRTPPLSAGLKVLEITTSIWLIESDLEEHEAANLNPEACCQKSTVARLPVRFSFPAGFGCFACLTPAPAS